MRGEDAGRWCRASDPGAMRPACRCTLAWERQANRNAADASPPLAHLSSRSPIPASAGARIREMKTTWAWQRRRPSGCAAAGRRSISRYLAPGRAARAAAHGSASTNSWSWPWARLLMLLLVGGEPNILLTRAGCRGGDPPTSALFVSGLSRGWARVDDGGCARLRASTSSSGAGARAAARCSRSSTSWPRARPPQSEAVLYARDDQRQRGLGGILAGGAVRGPARQRGPPGRAAGCAAPGPPLPTRRSRSIAELVLAGSGGTAAWPVRCIPSR